MAKLSTAQKLDAMAKGKTVRNKQLSIEIVRERAIRVLAVIADLKQSDRDRVLKKAMEMNEI